jgi:hypothetical protein
MVSPYVANGICVNPYATISPQKGSYLRPCRGDELISYCESVTYIPKDSHIARSMGILGIEGILGFLMITFCHILWIEDFPIYRYLHGELAKRTFLHMQKSLCLSKTTTDEVKLCPKDTFSSLDLCLILFKAQPCNFHCINDRAVNEIHNFLVLTIDFVIKSPWGKLTANNNNMVTILTRHTFENIKPPTRCHDHIGGCGGNIGRDKGATDDIV